MMSQSVEPHLPNRADREPSRKAFRSGWWLLLSLIFVVLVLYPPLYAQHEFGHKAIFQHLAPDAFYYLTVAKNSSIQFTTFDGETRTNGYHPLWQYSLIFVFHLLGDEQENQLHAVFLISCALVAAGLLVVAWSVRRVTGSWLAPFWLIPGIYSVLFSTMGRHSLSCWSYMNGMETPLSIFFWSIVIYILANRFEKAEGTQRADGTETAALWSDQTCFALGIATMACILTRLDDIFLLLSILVGIVVMRDGWFPTLRRLVIVAFPSLLGLALYCATNLLSDQRLLPVSGSLKCEGAIAANTSAVLKSLLPPLGEYLQEFPFDTQQWRRWVHRIPFSMILLMAISFGLIANILRMSRVDPLQFRKVSMLFPLLFSVVLKVFYNYSAVHWLNQGYWYYASSVLSLNFCAIIVIHYRLTTLIGDGTRRLAILGGVLWICLYLFSVRAEITRSGDPSPFFDLWQARRTVTRALRSIDPQMKVVDLQDGIVAYSLDLPVISGTGLAIDTEGFKALRNGEAVEYFLARGFDVVAIAPWAYPWTDRVKGYHLVQVFVHGPTKIEFFRLVRKGRLDAR